MPHVFRLPRLFAALFAQGLLAGACLAQTATLAPAEVPATGTTGGPVRLRSSTSAAPAALPGQATVVAPGSLLASTPAVNAPPAELPPGEFERYVQKLLEATAPLPAPLRAAEPSGASGGSSLALPLLAEPPRIRRFGADLMARIVDSDAVEDNPLVPPDYLLKPGDEVVVTLWGSVDAEVRAVVDRNGRITIPRVGPVFVSGVRYADLQDTIRARVGQVFRNFDVSASLGTLRGVRVFVTGYVARPGAYGVSSLSTLMTALARAGGPTPAGSFRQITLRRGSQVLSEFDLYGFLLAGDRSGDRLLQPGDVIQVGPVGPQVAFIGSVNQPAIFEIRRGETLADALAMAGGFSALADRARVAIERLDDRASVRIRELALPADAQTPLGHGDVIRAFSAVEASLPIQRQNKRVRVEGEVQRPGDYLLPPGSTLGDALRQAGGLTPAAYLFGTEFTRESVRIVQQQNYERALRDLETDVTRTDAQRANAAPVDPANPTNRGGAAQRLLERLRALKPTGRVVLQIARGQEQLPDLLLEDGDRLRIPPRSTTVGVFGSVFNGGSYLYSDGRTVDDYLRLAGGPTRGADSGSAFVVRANGTVVSGLQRGGWFNGSELEGVPAMPGDTVFVPEEVNKTTFVQSVKDWTQILYQLGIGLAGIASLR